MTLRTNAIILAVATLALPAAFAQTAGTDAVQQQEPEVGARATSYWLHPKLGMVKVDRATGFMVAVSKQQPRPSLQQPKPGHDHARTHKLM